MKPDKEIVDQARIDAIDSILSTMTLEELAGHIVRRDKIEKDSLFNYLETEYILKEISAEDAVDYYGDDVLNYISASDIVSYYDEDDLLEWMDVQDMNAMDDDEILAKVEDSSIFEYAIEKRWVINDMHFVDETFLNVLKEKQCLVPNELWIKLTETIKNLTI